MARAPVTVFLVEDSAIAATILHQLLDTTPDIRVIGSATNGIQALEQIPQLRPDVVCTDLHMPRMDGLELTRQLLATCPCPILVFSEATQPDASEIIEQLLQAGALAVLAKPKAALRADYEKLRHTLINQIKLLAGVTVITKPRRRSTTAPLASPPTRPLQTTASRPPIRPSHPDPPLPPPLPRSSSDSDYQILAIGASTGGPQAVHEILKQLPADYPLPILCTQHISQGFLPGLISWQDQHCELNVKIAEAREIPQRGSVYYAPDGVHLILDQQGRLAFSDEPPLAKHRPSISVMFEAVAQYYGHRTVGVLLTGMGQDGAHGMVAIAKAGGLTIAQNEASSVVFGMPKVAIELGAAQHILPIQRIGGFLYSITTPR